MGVVIGTAIGLGIGLLYAPRPGKETREMLKEKAEVAKEKASVYRDTDKKAKAKIETLKEKMPYRCGRFIISERSMPPRSVECETKGSKSVSIKLAGE